MYRPHFHLHVPHLRALNLLPKHVSRSVKELFGSVAILGFAMSAANLFEPIYLYTLDFSLAAIVLYYFVTYALYFFLIPLGAKFALRFGFERTILLGSIVLIVYYLTLFGIGAERMLFWVAPVVFALHKMFYWVGYHADFAQWSTDGETGREVGEASLIITLVTTIGPFVGGAIIAAFGFPALFLVISLLIFVSNFPLLTTKELVHRDTFSYTSAFKNLFKKDNRRQFFAMLGYGEDLLSFALWPIFLFLAVEAYFGVGVIVTVSSIITALFALYLGKMTDLRNRFRVLQVGVSSKILSWLGRLLTLTPVGLFVTDALYRVGASAIELPVLSETYSNAKTSRVMETIVKFEMGLICGRLLAVIIIVPFLFMDHPWPAVFIVGVILAPLYLFLPITKRGAASL